MRDAKNVCVRNNQFSSITYGYDAHGRPNTVTDARNGTTSFGFNNANQIAGVLTPAPGSGQSAQLTTNYFDTIGRVWKTTLPDNTSVTNEFYLTGLLKKIYGSRTYPVEYTYDAAGRMKTMRTWQDFTGNSGTAVTTWDYDDSRGWLTNKVYAGGQAGPGYTYTAAGRIKTRTWARGVTTTYGYSGAGDLTDVDYSDSTPNVTLGYDRRGRQNTAVASGITTAIALNDVGQLLGESYSGGILDGLIVSNRYDGLLRRTNVAVFNASTLLAGTGYGYDNASRLSTVGDGTNTATYSYLANSPLVENIRFTNNGALRMTTTKSYDYLNRLTQISSAPSGMGVPPVSFAYAYNSANQRTAVTNAGASRWSYGYDVLGQVTTGKKYWSDSTGVAGQQFEYTFDDIGNRKTTKSGGDSNGLNLRSAAYSADLLNQYTNRTVPGFVSVLGEATNAATVTVNLQSTERHGDYFRAELTVTNTSPLWLGITNIAVLNNGTNADIIATNTGNLFVAQTPEVFGYDADGNMTNDGCWMLTWDAENRLTKVESLVSGPTASKRKVEWTFDAFGRRIRQTTYDGSSGSYVATEDLKFLSDGWRNVAELNATNNAVVRSYAWGLDLSGSLGGAGGVGGLLMINRVASGTHFYAMDGNGNVRALVSSADGTVSANYEFEPFGITLRATGPMALENPFRFSTKRANDSTDWMLYEYRPYAPSLGRWLGRDSMEENYGPNIYSFIFNRPTDGIDTYGEQGFFIPANAHQIPNYAPTPIPPPPPKGIEVVTIPKLGPDNGAQLQLRQAAVRNFPNEGYEVISVSDVADANAKLKRCKNCIETLHIEGHGAGTGQWVGPVDPKKGERAFWVRDKPSGGYEFINVNEMFNGVKFCKPCTIWLRGCRVAGDPILWKVLKDNIATQTGCDVRAFAVDTCVGKRGLSQPQ